MSSFLLRRFPALAAPDFRLFFLGQFISQSGTWMQSIAAAWLIYRITESPFWLGLASFASQAPILFLSPLAGVLNDRFDRRRILLVTQSAALLQALMLALITTSSAISPFLLVALTFLLGTIHAVDLPARQAFLSQLVADKARLPSAIGLNSFLMNACRFIGPALAGVIVTHYGEQACFFLNAISYAAAILALLVIRPSGAAAPRAEPFFAALSAGLRHALAVARIRHTLTLVAAFSFFVTPYATLMPVFARDLFGGNATLYGALLASAGLGSLSAALYLAGSNPERLLLRVVRAARGAGIFLAAFAATAWLPAAYPLLVGLGFTVILTIAGANTLIQLAVADRFRGRVMSLFSTAFLGIGPLGSLAAGIAAEHFGARTVLTVCSLIVLALAIVLGERLKKTPGA